MEYKKPECPHLRTKRRKGKDAQGNLIWKIYCKDCGDLIALEDRSE